MNIEFIIQNREDIAASAATSTSMEGAAIT